MSEGISRRKFAALAGAGVAAGVAAKAGPVDAHRDERPFNARHGHGHDGRKRPNILVIVADDLGWGDLSCFGAPDIRTPNLDRLAASGVRFTQSYTASSVCSPTRFGLYTGRYPGRLQGGLQEPIGAANATDGIPPGHPTIASLLKEQGYDTALIGKWHGGFLPAFGPLKSGWDEFFGNYSGGLDYFSKYAHTGKYDLFDGEKEVQDERYYTDILTEKAQAFLKRRHRKPWLLNLHYTTPHWPWEGRGDKAVSDELTAQVKAGNGFALFHNDGGSLEKYKEMVEDLDRSVGKVLSALERSGQADDTVVFFMSDNGGERFSYQWPFSGAKGGLQEGSIRTPTILSWPGKVGRRQVNDTKIITMDWTATFLELAGAEPHPDYPLDGVSLVDHLFRGRPKPERDLFWRMKGQRALRRGDLKYLQGTDKAEHLYDLAADVHEQADLKAKRPADFAALKGAWEAINATQLQYA